MIEEPKPRHPEILEAEIAKLEDRILKIKKELQDSKKTYTKCPSCKKWTLDEHLIPGSYRKTETETVYRDAGYGDDDELAEVTRAYLVMKCPHCGYEIRKHSYIVSEANRRTRR